MWPISIAANTISFVQHPRHQQVLIGNSFSLECTALLINPLSSAGLTQGNVILYFFTLDTSTRGSDPNDVFVYPTSEGFPYRTISNVSTDNDGTTYQCSVVAILLTVDIQEIASSHAELTVHSKLKECKHIKTT